MLTLVPILVIFAEPGFPMIDVARLPEIEQAVECRSVEELERELQPGRVLVWRHGSAFPIEAWEPLMQFLEGGGSMLILGGEPFTRPVTGPPGGRIVGTRSLAMLKALHLSQCYRLPIANGERRPLAGWASSSLLRQRLGDSSWAAVLEPRLSDTQNHPLEEGSSGSRDAVLHPLMHVFENHPRSSSNLASQPFPIAAAAIAIDRLRGPWAGGRWVFWLISEPPSQEELAALIEEARKPALDFRIDPTMACFHEGERPSLRVRLHRPNTTSVDNFAVTLRCTSSDGAPVFEQSISFTAGEHALFETPLPLEPRPGLYRVQAESENLPTATSGFWVFDPELFSSGDPLSFDGFTLRRHGRPEPVIGTTVMSATVQRQFLFEPNAAVWDDTMAELAELRINLIRTGVWDGYRAVSIEAGSVSEAWMRSLEAFYLTARRHDIPVLFTFFAFLPESFGGQNPYMDPRAIEGQGAYVSAVSRRFAPARHMFWDLINEPSFSSPDQLWKCRPNGDEHERRTFMNWLQRRFEDPAQGHPAGWEDRVRARWRLAPDDPIDLPALKDFDATQVLQSRRPYRAADYVHFAQDAFADWCRELTRAIRESGSTAAITVGQDEGGILQRPSPLFHHEAVDFTSMHTWWFNDALLFDGLAAKAVGKPLLISETGVMQRELLSGEALRTPDDAARLLSRKIAYAFGSGAFGAVQWCYDTNAYMTSDNEVSIGLRRADGSYKPEHRILRQFADFVARNRRRFDSPREPSVALILPSGEQFSSRDTATPAVRRSIDVLTRWLGRGPRLVPDPRVQFDLGKPKAIILPANKGISESAWQAIRAACASGSILICSGWFEVDEVGLPATRIGGTPRVLALRELIHPESEGSSPVDGSQVIKFPLEATQSWYAAAGAPAPTQINLNGMQAWHHPLPLEWSESDQALQDFYAAVLTRDGFGAHPQITAPEGLTVQIIEFKESSLVVTVNETSAPQTLRLGDSGVDLPVPPGESRLAFVTLDGTKVLDVSGDEDD